MAIPEAHIHNMKELIRAAKADRLTLLECKDAKTGEPRFVIAGVSDDQEKPDSYLLVPFGHLCNDDPYAEYIPPGDDAQQELPLGETKQ